MNKYALGTIVGTALLGLAKAKRGGRNEYKPRKIEDIYTLSLQQKAQITELNLSDKRLTHLPDDIFDGFTSLEQLWLHRNQLTEIPDSIGNLTNLEKLSLHTNQLTELPQWIGNLTNLERLWLSGNAWQKPVPKETILKMIRNRVQKSVINNIIDMNNSIPPTKSKSNLRIR